MKKFALQNKGISLGIISALLFGILLLVPAIADVIYRRGLFQLVRIFFDYSLNLLPFSSALVVVPLAMFFAVRYLVHRTFSLVSIVLGILNIAGFLLFAFFCAWGFNYSCPTLVSKATFSTAPLSVEELYSFGQDVNQHASVLRTSLREEAPPLSANTENEVRECLEQVLQEMHIPTLGRVRCRVLDENGIMRQLGVAGIYFPFSGEGLTNSTYLPPTLLFIMAHEMSHGYGITNEGEADLCAYIALAGSKDSFFRYAAELELLRNIRGRLKNEDFDRYQLLRAQADTLVDSDLRAIFRNGLAYQEYFPGMQEKMNNSYLKLLGIKEGTGSYDAFIELVFQSRQARWPVPREIWVDD